MCSGTASWLRPASRQHNLPIAVRSIGTETLELALTCLEASSRHQARPRFGFPRASYLGSPTAGRLQGLRGQRWRIMHSHMTHAGHRPERTAAAWPPCCACTLRTTTPRPALVQRSTHDAAAAAASTVTRAGPARADPGPAPRSRTDSLRAPSSRRRGCGSPALSPTDPHPPGVPGSRRARTKDESPRTSPNRGTGFKFNRRRAKLRARDDSASPGDGSRVRSVRSGSRRSWFLRFTGRLRFRTTLTGVFMQWRKVQCAKEVGAPPSRGSSLRPGYSTPASWRHGCCLRCLCRCFYTSTSGLT